MPVSKVHLTSCQVRNLPTSCQGRNLPTSCQGRRPYGISNTFPNEIPNAFHAGDDRFQFHAGDDVPWSHAGGGEGFAI